MQRNTDQISSRPVERPQQDEPSGNQNQQGSETSRVLPNTAFTRFDGTAETASNARAKPQDGESSEQESTATDRAQGRGSFDLNPTRPASVGALLDVVA
jgi:hypothetical protein